MEVEELQRFATYSWFVASLVAVWIAFSEPGVPWVLLGPASIFGVSAILLLICRIGLLRDREAGTTDTLVPGLLITLLLVPLILGIPLKLRWISSRSAFEKVVTQIDGQGRSGDPELVDVTPTIGSYWIDHALWTSSGVIFYNKLGSGLVDDAGFAYLPKGPGKELESPSFESPHFVHLGGAWYRWTASW